ncbi:hypothetical protein AB1M95_05205 [Sulfitobacter sp. LCG007]
MTNDIESPRSHPSTELVMRMVDCHQRGDFENAYDAAQQLLVGYSLEDFDDTQEFEKVGHFFARAFSTQCDASNAALRRQFHDAAAGSQAVLDLVAHVRWQENLDGNPIFREFRKIHLEAAVNIPLMKATEAAMRGSYDTATRHVLSAGAYLPQISAILNKDAPEADHYMRPTAMTVISGQFLIGAAIHMANANTGNNLIYARLFFERMDALFADFALVEIDQPHQERIIAFMHDYANAARIHVDAEIAAAEENYALAVIRLTESISAFERIAAAIPPEMPNLEVVQETMMNMGKIVSQGIRHYSMLDMMKSKLEHAANADAAMKERMADHDRWRNEVILAFAKQNFNFSFENVNQIANDINIRNDVSIAMQDAGMDQVLLLLSRLPHDRQTETLMADAKAAKNEKDLMAKMEKVVAVMDGASKVADAASKLVPYGPQVMSALRGIFGLLPLRRETPQAASLPEPVTV